MPDNEEHDGSSGSKLSIFPLARLGRMVRSAATLTRYFYGMNTRKLDSAYLIRARKQNDGGKSFKTPRRPFRFTKSGSKCLMDGLCLSEEAATVTFHSKDSNPKISDRSLRFNNSLFRARLVVE